MTSAGNKTEVSHWDAMHSAAPRPRLPSRFLVGTRNIQSILSRHIRPGMSVLEIGFAPGKMLAWVRSELRAEVSGIDYSDTGFAHALNLFSALKLSGDLRREDVFANSFTPASMDVVYSLGVIEHFDDPSRIVREHLRLLKPGGTLLALIPNYGGIYGSAQGWFDPVNLAIHNLEIMCPENLVKLVREEHVRGAEAFPAGKFNAGMMTPQVRFGRRVGQVFFLAGNLLGLLQPLPMEWLCPLLVLKAMKAD